MKIKAFAMKKDNTSTPDTPPFLQDLHVKGTGFSLPEGYFDDLESSVMARLEAAGDLKRPLLLVTKRPGLFASLIRPPMLWASAAALVLLLAAVWLIRTPSAPVNQTGLAAGELTEEDIEQYLLDNATQFEPVQLAALSKEAVTVAPDTPVKGKPIQHTPLELRPEDLNYILDEMTDEELEQIL